jgi:hypothetical protein
MRIIKPIGNLITLTSTANSFSNATLVYIATGNQATVNVAYSNGTNRFSFSIPANQFMFVSKDPTDVLTANLAVSATAAAYRG